MFEKTTWIRLPRNVVIGHGVLDRTREAIAELHLQGSPLIVTSPTPREVAAERIVADFAAHDVDPTLIEIETATRDSVDRVINRIQEIAPGYLIGVGGGKPIDIAKLAAAETGRGFISVPTAASHDGIVSGRASIPEGDMRHSIAADPPLAVIADTEILAAAPWKLTTAGAADIISNYTAVADWRLAQRLKNVPFSDYAAALSEMTAEMLVGSADSILPGVEESTWIVMKALVSSGVAMSIAGSSRPASGAEHLFSHRLDQITPETALHGHQVGVGSIMTAYLHGGDNGMWQSIKRALETIDAPTTAAELGIADEQVIEALTTAHTIRDRYTILGDGIERSAAEQLARKTGVID